MIHSDHDPSLSSDGLQCRQYGNRYPSLKCCKIPLIPNSIFLQIIKITQTVDWRSSISRIFQEKKNTWTRFSPSNANPITPGQPLPTPTPSTKMHIRGTVVPRLCQGKAIEVASRLNVLKVFGSNFIPSLLGFLAALCFIPFWWVVPFCNEW